MKRLILPLVVLVWIAFIACQNKQNDIITPLRSSAKSISSVVFRVEENPDLFSDIAATITGDTVKAFFPIGFRLGNVVPTITFSGKLITPSNQTLQNFLNPFTYTITAEDGSTRKYVFVCKDFDTTILISGRWKVLTDIVSNTGNFFYIEGGVSHIPVAGVYPGNAADYYEFKRNTDSVVVVENGLVTSSTYEITGDQLSVAALSVYPAAKVVTLNLNAATFFWTATSANGGHYTRQLFLIK